MCITIFVSTTNRSPRIAGFLLRGSRAGKAAFMLRSSIAPESLSDESLTAYESPVRIAFDPTLPPHIVALLMTWQREPVKHPAPVSPPVKHTTAKTEPVTPKAAAIKKQAIKPSKKKKPAKHEVVAKPLPPAKKDTRAVPVASSPLPANVALSSVPAPNELKQSSFGAGSHDLASQRLGSSNHVPTAALVLEGDLDGIDIAVPGDDSWGTMIADEETVMAVSEIGKHVKDRWKPPLGWEDGGPVTVELRVAADGSVQSVLTQESTIPAKNMRVAHIARNIKPSQKLSGMVFTITFE